MASNAQIEQMMISYWQSRNYIARHDRLKAYTSSPDVTNAFYTGMAKYHVAYGGSRYSHSNWYKNKDLWAGTSTTAESYGKTYADSYIANKKAQKVYQQQLAARQAQIAAQKQKEYEDKQDAAHTYVADGERGSGVYSSSGVSKVSKKTSSALSIRSRKAQGRTALTINRLGANAGSPRSGLNMPG